MTRPRDFLDSVQLSGNGPKVTVPSRHGGLLLWVLPALAALALATLLLTTPSEPELSPRPVPDVNPLPPANQPTLTWPQSTDTGADSKTRNVSQTSPRLPGNDKPQGNSPSGMSLAEAQRAVTGEWTGFYQGQRRLTVREGGKATMLVEPEGLGSLLLAPKLTFEVLWKVNGDHLEFETVGGDPADKVEVVVKMFGKHRKHRIVDLKPERIVLLDEDGVTEYVWRRVMNASR